MPRHLSIAVAALLILSPFAAQAADPASLCTAIKLKAAGKKYAAKAKCQAVAVLKNQPVDADCIQKAEEKFAAVFAKADAKGSCPGTTDDIEAGIDVCLADLVSDLSPAPSTTTLPPDTSTTTMAPVDITPPSVVSASTPSSSSVLVTFDEALSAASVSADGSNFTLDNGAVISAAALQPGGSSVLLSSSTLVAATTYTVSVSGVTDLAGNPITAPNDQAQFTLAAFPATVRINEVNANIGFGCDLVELRALAGGSLAGFSLHERDSETLVTFPDGFEVQADDLVVVHMNSSSPTCNPGSATQETSSTAQQPSAVYAGNYDTAYDFWSVDTGLVSTQNVLTLYDAEAAIADAVFLADNPTGTTTAATETQAAIVAAANEWQQVGGGVPAGGFVDDAFCGNAAQDLNATGTTASGASIQRLDDSDDNDVADWNSGGITVQPSTFGVLNAGQ